MIKITLRQMEVFTVLANHPHVTLAAEAMGLTQSAASMALADLEQQLGKPLFDRIGRQLVLNDAGRRLQPRAMEVLNRVRSMEFLVPSKAPACDLHLGASLTIGKHLMPALLAELEKRHPSTQVRLSTRNTEQVVTDLLSQRLDLGFVEEPVQDKRLQRFFCRPDRLCVFAAPDHPLVTGNATPADLQTEPWLVREPGSGSREVFDRAMRTAGIIPRRITELEQTEAIRQSVRAGRGLGCLSILELQDAFRAGWLAPVETHFLNLERSFQVVLRRDRPLSRELRTVLSLCGIDGV